MWLYAPKVSARPKSPKAIQESRIVITNLNFLYLKLLPPILKAFLSGNLDLINLKGELSLKLILDSSVFLNLLFDELLIFMEALLFKLLI